MINAWVYLTNGQYVNGGKRDITNDERRNSMLLEVSGKLGVFVDEIVPFGDFSVWFYHGNPIVYYNRKTTALLLGNCGFETLTTKERLSSLPGVFVRQRNHQWYNGEEPFVSRSQEISERIAEYFSDTINTKVESYVRIDGWRGHTVPYFAVLGASDTGMWEDSPARSDTVESELAGMQERLRKIGIRTYVAHSVTSNVFCMKRWLIVKGKDFPKAVNAVRGLSREIGEKKTVYIPFD